MATTTESRELLIVEFGTPIAEENAVAVASTIHALAAILEEARKQAQLSERLELKIQPFREGSLETWVQLVVAGGAVLVAYQQQIAYLFDCLKEYITARKGKQEMSSPAGNSVVIHGDIKIDNRITVSDNVVTLLKNPDLSILVDKAAVDIEGDETIKGVKLLKGKKREPIAEIKREELPKFRYGTTPAVDLPKKEKMRRKAIVVIHTPVLKGRGKWTVVYKAKTIEAPIEDEEF